MEKSVLYLGIGLWPWARAGAPVSGTSTAGRTMEEPPANLGRNWGKGAGGEWTWNCPGAPPACFRFYPGSRVFLGSQILCLCLLVSHGHATGTLTLLYDLKFKHRSLVCSPHPSHTGLLRFLKYKQVSCLRTFARAGSSARSTFSAFCKVGSSSSCGSQLLA